MKESSRAKSADRDVFVPTSDTRVTITTGVKSAEQVRTGLLLPLLRYSNLAEEVERPAECGPETASVVVLSTHAGAYWAHFATPHHRRAPATAGVQRSLTANLPLPSRLQDRRRRQWARLGGYRNAFPKPFRSLLATKSHPWRWMRQRRVG
jgi:hypothetical protein